MCVCDLCIFESCVCRMVKRSKADIALELKSDEQLQPTKKRPSPRTPLIPKPRAHQSTLPKSHLTKTSANKQTSRTKNPSHAPNQTRTETLRSQNITRPKLQPRRHDPRQLLHPRPNQTHTKTPFSRNLTRAKLQPTKKRPTPRTPPTHAHRRFL